MVFGRNTRTHVGETERRIKANDWDFNSQFPYASNYIKTSKYSLLTFLPLNLFEQFQRLANFYFLCLLMLQLIPLISSLTPVTTALPLIGVLTLTAMKDAFDDYQRHCSDMQVNARRSLVLRQGHLSEVQWQTVRVGDVVRMEHDQHVTADLLLLSTSEPNGLCFVETAELDGETNLKCRQALTDTAAMQQDESLLSQFDGEIVCEPPNNNLNKFEGTLTWKEQRYALDSEKLLLRGCILRNTSWCYGVVVFAGRDSKLMQNSGKTKFKRTSIDRLLNYIILGIVFFLALMCLFCTIASGIWETATGQYFRMFLPWDSLVPNDATGGATVIALLVFLSYAIVLNTVVPISLYVSVEVIRLVQSYLINWDVHMYHVESDTPAKARTTTLNEELGQIQYIFSDKTGTLTQNIMAFKKCSVLGHLYGECYDYLLGEHTNPTEDSPAVDFSANHMYEPKFRFYDSTLLEAVHRNDADVHRFFRLLSLCHTVMPQRKDGQLLYQAQSPDEDALVSAARNFGFVFVERTPTSITVECEGEREQHQLLCILDFNNVRKRMSVVVERAGVISLYCKGADSVLMERMSPDVTEQLRVTTEEHLQRFASEGLRTLVLAYKQLDPDYFSDWRQRHHEASVAMSQREEQVDALYEELERDLLLVGATAVEDKLQNGVPETIANLTLAGIKIWVLTGDKEETAINIGYSCQLLTDDLEDLLIVNSSTVNEVEQELNSCLARLDSTPIRPQHRYKNSISVITYSDEGYGHDSPLTGNVQLVVPSEMESAAIDAEAALTAAASGGGEGGFALVISGQSLIWALTSRLEEQLMSVACRCRAVICCRVTPLQKALVVKLVKRHREAVTLSIGDGANDVSMIKTADIGVGISGQEGLQAVLASDYSIAQFRFLERLLLVHGRWSYYRMCKFMRYFFYKNFSFTLCHFWYAFFCGFSAQTVFDPMFIAIFNLVYTSWPVLAMAMLDQDISQDNSTLYPKLYTPGITNLFFNKFEFAKTAAFGFVSSFLIFALTYGTYHDAVSVEGYSLSDHQLFGSVVATILVVVVTVQISLDTTYWTWFNHVCVWGSLAAYLILHYFYNYVIGGPYVGALTMAMGEGAFWLTVLLSVVTLLVPVLCWRFYCADTRPTLADRLRLKQRADKQHRRRLLKQVHRTPSARPRARSIRSGYAFSHQEGFGRLITSGKMMQRTVSSLSRAVAAAAAASTNSPTNSEVLNNEAANGVTLAISLAVPPADSGRDRVAVQNTSDK